MDCPNKKVLNMLEGVFETVTTLQSYLQQINDLPQLLHPADRVGYKTLLCTTLIGIPKGAKSLAPNPSLQCCSHQREIILRAVERIRKRDGHRQNLLTFGFNQMSDNPCAQISTSPGTEYSYPNSNTLSLLGVGWKTLLTRIGDTIMQHLLESTAIFLPCPPSSYIQIAGPPVYDLWPYTAHTNFKIPSPVQESRKRKKFYVRRNVKNKKTNPQSSVLQEQVLVNQSCNKVVSEDGNNVVKSDSNRKKRKRCVVSDAETGDHHCTKRPRIELKILDTETVEYGSSVEEQVNCDNSSLNNSESVSLFSGENKVSGNATCCESVKHGTDYIDSCIENPLCSVTVCDAGDMGKMDTSLVVKELATVHDSVEKKKVRFVQNEHPSENVANTGHATGAPQGRKKRRKRKKKPPPTEDEEKTPPYTFHLYVDRRTLLYARDLREQFTGEGVWCHEATEEGAQELFTKIFMNSDVRVSMDMSEEDLLLLKQCVLPKLLTLLKFHRKCAYSLLLDYYSPRLPRKLEMTNQSSEIEALIFKRGETNPSSQTSVKALIGKKKNKKKTAGISELELLQHNISHRQVYLFLRRIIKSVIPADMFGSKSSHNRNVFYNNVRSFISLGRYEKFCLGQLMNYVKVLDADWLSNLRTGPVKQHCMALWLWWLLTGFIMPILKSFFYMTDTTVYRNRVFFYRKKTWKQLRQKTVNGYLKTGMLSKCSKEEVDRLIASGQSLGISTLRFMPKSQSLRPIVNMGKTQGQKSNSINRQLQNLHHVLSSHKEGSVGVVGSAVYGMDDIYTAWRHFIQYRPAATSHEQMYFVKVDIRKCYDTILQKKLFDIIKQALNEHGDEQYVVRRWATVISSGQFLKRTFNRTISTLGEFQPNFQRFACSLAKRKKLRNAILVDQVLHMEEKASELLKKLQAHLFNNIIRIGASYFVQREGISQGAVTSTQLCNYYYGHMEREKQLPHSCQGRDGQCACAGKDDRQDSTLVCDPTEQCTEVRKQPRSHIHSTESSHHPKGSHSFRTTVNSRSGVGLKTREDELLLRMVDDSLFVTPYKEHAAMFLDAMLGGFEDYNCYVNADKSVVNFDCGHPDVQELKSGEWLAWCGLLINPATLEVQADYTRYAGLTMRDTITLNVSHQPGTSLKQKLISSMKAKCHQLFFDPLINSTEVITLNLYKLFLLAACQFHNNARCLPQKAPVNPRFFVQLILSLPRIFLHQIMLKLRAREQCQVLSAQPMEWLCLTAFVEWLTPHQGGYHNLLPTLANTLRNLSHKLDKKMLLGLQMAVAEALPAEFKLILG